MKEALNGKVLHSMFISGSVFLECTKPQTKNCLFVNSFQNTINDTCETKITTK